MELYRNIFNLNIGYIFMAIVGMLVLPADAYNGDFSELECPNACDCYYFRINWVTDCSESDLTEIPYSELSQKVYILDLNGNNITDIQPFPADIKMRRLQMADNYLTQLRSESFLGLDYLIDCDFANNRISKIDPKALEDCQGLINFEIQNNPLDPIEGSFLSSSTLLYLDISNCSLRDLNPNFFKDIPSLSTIDLSENAINVIKSGVFDVLTSLEVLKMNSCNLTQISVDAFQNQSTLKILELSGNAFGSVEWYEVLGPLHRLEHLDLRKSGLKHLNEDMFNRSTFLRTLILAENDLMEFDVATTIGRQLNLLETLDLSFCNLSKPLSEEAFNEATKIRSLNLSGNTLFASDLLVALSPLSMLEKLSLSNCELSRLPDTFYNFKSLRELDISNNPLNDVFVKLISPLNTLEYLNMGYSNLSYLAPESFSKMTSMKRLVLSGNDLNSLEAGLFANLTNLESLDLSFCGLRRPLNATVFFTNFTYTDLKELHLAGNPLRVTTTGVLLPKQLSRLEILDISNCNLTILPNEAFKWTPNIRQLFLRGNHFNTIPALQPINVLSQLELLDLRQNQLRQTFKPSELDFTMKLDHLRLVGNPWQCNCDIAALWSWAATTKGTLSVLEAATISVEHVTAGKVKRKNLLVCTMDSDASRPPYVSGAMVAVKTWAKYVKEAKCDEGTNKNALLRRSRRNSVTKENIYVKEKWSNIALVAVTVYFVLVGIIFISYNFMKHRQKFTVRNL